MATIFRGETTSPDSNLARRSELAYHRDHGFSLSTTTVIHTARALVPFHLSLDAEHEYPMASEFREFPHTRSRYIIEFSRVNHFRISRLCEVLKFCLRCGESSTLSGNSENMLSTSASSLEVDLRPIGLRPQP